MSETVSNVAADVIIVDGAITMEADGGATIYIDAPEHTPLSASEEYARLRVVGDVADFKTVLSLDAEQLDALADAIYHAQQAHEEDDR